MHDDLDCLFKLTPNQVKIAIKVAEGAFEDDPIMLFTYPDEKEEDTIIMFMGVPNSEF